MKKQVFLEYIKMHIIEEAIHFYFEGANSEFSQFYLKKFRYLGAVYMRSGMG